MRKYAGASFIVLGILLAAWGIDSGEPFTSRMGRLFTGWLIDWPLLIGGILSMTVGLSLTSYRKSRA